MADNHGGYRKPANPAPVSGPGSLSQRTDGGPASKQAIRSLPDAGYGEQAEFRGIQTGAPIAKVEPQKVPSIQADEGIRPLPLDAPSARSDEPVTAGANAGPGPGMDSLGLLDESNLAASDVKYLLQYLPTLQWIVDTNPNSSFSTRALVRFLRSQV